MCLVVRVSKVVVAEFKRIIEESEVTKEDDNNWPEPDKIGRQELEIRNGKEHISFNVRFFIIFYCSSCQFIVYFGDCCVVCQNWFPVKCSREQ